MRRGAWGDASAGVVHSTLISPAVAVGTVLYSPALGALAPGPGGQVLWPARGDSIC